MYIASGQLTVHADRGSSMTSKPVAFLLADLGVLQDAQPAVHLDGQPLQRGAVQDAEIPARISRPVLLDGAPPRVRREFFAWYNHQHRHSGIG